MLRPICLVLSVLAIGFIASADAGAEEVKASLLADMCTTCHGPEGHSPGAVPAIAALDVEVMRAFLLGFREGDIEATVMDRIARALTDVEIDALARQFGGGAE